MISCLSQQYSDPYLSPTTPTLPLPSVSLIRALLAYQYMPLASLNLPAILVFSLLSTLLPTDPLLLSSSTTPPPPTIWAPTSYLPTSATCPPHLTTTVTTTDHCHTQLPILDRLVPTITTSRNSCHQDHLPLLISIAPF